MLGSADSKPGRKSKPGRQRVPFGSGDPGTKWSWMRVALLVPVLSLLASTILVDSPAMAASTLAPGFSVRDLPSGQTEQLTDFAFTPDGSYFTTGKGGRVAWVSV